MAKERIRYVLIPHPDDEFSAWSLIGNRPDLYPVFVLLTQGENTSFCDGRGLQADKGERIPLPQPFTGAGTDNCRRQRLDAWHAFLDAMAAVDDGLDVPPYAGLVDGACHVFVGPKTARVVFDGGDGGLTPEFVTAALARARQLRFTHLPLRTESDVVGAAYYNENSAGSLIYAHPDHRTVHLALWGIDHGLPGPQWGRTARGDEDAAPPHGRTEHVDRDVYRRVVSADPHGTRTGILQVVYGWLAFEDDGKWVADETDETTLFSRSQTFWGRF